MTGCLVDNRGESARLLPSLELERPDGSLTLAIKKTVSDPLRVEQELILAVAERCVQGVTGESVQDAVMMPRRATASGFMRAGQGD